MVDAFTLFNLFFSSDDDDDWSSSDESDDENKEKLQALSQKMAELKQAEQKIWLKIMADRKKEKVTFYYSLIQSCWLLFYICFCRKDRCICDALLWRSHHHRRRYY